MGQFDYEDDEKDKAYEVEAELEQPSSGASSAKPSALDAFLASYQSANDDNAAVKEAEESAKSKNMWTGILQGASTAFAGKDRTDSKFYDGLRAKNDAAVEQARGDKKSKLADLWQKYQAQRQGKQDGREETDFSNKQEDRKLKSEKEAPNHPRAVSARDVMSKKLGIPPETFGGMGYDEIMETSKAILQQRATAASRPAGQQVKYTAPDGRVLLGSYNPQTLRYESASGQPLEGDVVAGFALGYDPSTGTLVNKADPTKNAETVTADTGDSVRDLRTTTDAGRAAANATAKEGVKADVEVAEAQARQQVWGSKFNKYRELAQQARKEGWAGRPLEGRAALFAQQYGFSAGEATDTLANLLERDLQAQILETTGKAATDSERQAIKKVAASLYDQDGLFDNKLNAWQAQLGSKTKEKEAKRDIIKGGAPAPAPKTPSVSATPEETELLIQYRADYPGKSDDELLKAIRKSKVK